jgi:hypothetical protein
MKPIRKVALAVALVAVALTAPAPVPAFADHDNKLCVEATYNCNHWGNRYSPPVYANGSSQALTNWVQDAGYLWQDNGFVQGWNPGAFPGYSSADCSNERAPTFLDGSIHICIVVASHALLRLAGYPHNSTTYITRYSNRCDTACNHIYAATIYINGQADSATIQRSFRHAIGEALGMTTTTVQDSVMKLDPWSPYATQHDRDVMYYKYGNHVSG